MQTWAEHRPNHQLFLRLVNPARTRVPGLGGWLCRHGWHSWTTRYAEVKGGRWNDYAVWKVCKRCPEARVSRGAF